MVEYATTQTHDNFELLIHIEDLDPQPLNQVPDRTYKATVTLAPTDAPDAEQTYTYHYSHTKLHSTLSTLLWYRPSSIPELVDHTITNAISDYKSDMELTDAIASSQEVSAALD